MIVDTVVSPTVNRYQAMEKVDEILGEPFGAEEAEEFHRDLWNQKNVAAMRSGVIGTPDDPHFMG
jgi:hypothetical protein